jgi:type VII secretion protein EccE
VSNVDAQDNTPVGVGHDHAGWFAVTAVAPPSGMRGDAVSSVPVDRLTRAITESQQPGAVLQVVVHTIPAPSVEVDARHRCTTSYRELLESFGQVPASQTIWVAVRLDARTLAETGADPDAFEQAPAVVAALIRRVGRTLTRAGLTHQILDADGLLDALTRSCDLEQPPPGSRVPVARERWQSWQSARLAHACFWLSRWPEPGATAELIGRLVATRAALTSVALVVAPGEEGVDVRFLVRVATHPPALTDACRTMAEVAKRSGAELFRLDGEQGPGVYASAPTGGGAG